MFEVVSGSLGDARPPIGRNRMPTAPDNGRAPLSKEGSTQSTATARSTDSRRSSGAEAWEALKYDQDGKRRSSWSVLVGLADKQVDDTGFKEESKACAIL